MKVIFTESAQAELLDAVAYYEFEYRGLGKKFKQAVKSSIAKIVQFPETCSFDRGYQKRLCRQRHQK